MKPPSTLIEQEFQRIYATDLSKKSPEELKAFKEFKKTYTQVLGSIQYKLDAQNMSQQALENEKHRSARMGRFLSQEGMPKPGNGFDAHAIISGKDRRALDLRAEMAFRKIRIDDTDNGCWLPRTSMDAVGTRFPNATPHRRIHTMRYFEWLARVALRIDDETTPVEFRRQLKAARNRLQDGTVTGRVLNP